MLIAVKAPHRRPRVAARWLLRFLEEHSTATIEEAALAAGALTALGGSGHAEARATLVALAERVTSERRPTGRARRQSSQNDASQRFD